MVRCYCTVLCFLFVTAPATAQDAADLRLREQLDSPYAALFDLEAPAFEYSQNEANNLRSTLEHDRKQRIRTCESEEKTIKGRLQSARGGLKQLNASASSDTTTMAAGRRSLHLEIAALEQVFRDKQRECRQVLPSDFEIKIAKAHLLARWPQERAEVERAIESGRARSRKHGDIEDIGYRKLAANLEKDIAVGEQALRQMQSNGLMSAQLQDDSVQQYVQSLAGRIARNSDLSVPVRVTVLDSSDINAVGLPGGFLLVTSGLLRACENESELAGVLSQQIAHVAARHATRTSKRSILAKIFAPAAQIATGVFTGGVSNAGAYYGMNYGFEGLNVVMNRALAGSNAKATKEADQLGIQYAWKAGFDPKGHVRFVDSLAKGTDYSANNTYILTDPPLGERLLEAFAEIRYLPLREDATIDSPEFVIAKQRLQGRQ